MTINEARTYTRPWLTVTQAAPLIGTDPHSLRLQARLEPDRLGFPVIVCGTRVKIPRVPFLRFIGCECPDL